MLDLEKTKKIKEGLVVSDRMNKTVVVEVKSHRSHKLYKKQIKSRKRFKAHDENSECVIGDVVRIIETRPLSKGKRWRVDKILIRGDRE